MLFPIYGDFFVQKSRKCVKVAVSITGHLESTLNHFFQKLWKIFQKNAKRVLLLHMSAAHGVLSREHIRKNQ